MVMTHICTEWDYHVNALLGIPFKYRGTSPEEGLDCWGLVCLFQEKLRGIRMSAHTEVYRNKGILDTAVRYEVQWYRLAPTDKSRFGDILLFSPLNGVMHCGVALDSQTMLHVAVDGFSSPEAFNNALWRPRLASAPYGIYRYTGGSKS